MTDLPTRYALHLSRDSEERARLVSRMAQAADVLDGSTPYHPVPAEVPHMLARDLRDAAQQLCDHARVTGIRCRYCNAVVESGSYPTETEADS